MLLFVNYFKFYMKLSNLHIYFPSPLATVFYPFGGKFKMPYLTTSLSSQPSHSKTYPSPGEHLLGVRRIESVACISV